MHLKSNLTNREITHDTVMKKASLPLLPTFERGGGNAPVIFLLSGVPGPVSANSEAVH